MSTPTITTPLADITRLYRSGLTIREVGDELGISAAAVQKRLAAAGVPRRSATEYLRDKYGEWVATDTGGVRRAVLANEGDLRAAADDLCVPISWVQRWVDSTPDLRVLVRTMNGAPRATFTESDILRALRRAWGRAKLHGHEVLTRQVYAEYAKASEPTYHTIVVRYGMWTAACAAARVPSAAPVREYEPGWDEQGALNAFRPYVRDCQQSNTIPTVLDYLHRWKPEHDCPSTGTLRKLFGSWRALVWGAATS